MKAVVAQIVGHHAVLLTEDGVFVKVRNQRYRTGQQITFCEKRRLPAKALAMAASLAVFLLGGTFLALLRLPYSYVSVDVNPSMEYTLNWFDRVLSLHAVNEDAIPIAQSLQKSGVLNQPIAAAVGMTIRELNTRQYFADGTENDVVISVASFGLKDVKGLAGTLKDSAGSALDGHALCVTAIQTDAGKVQEAQKYHTTAGKLVIVEGLAQGGENLSDGIKEDWLKKPVREILGHKNGNAPNGNEKKNEETEHVSDTVSTNGLQPEDTVSPSTKRPDKSKAPVQTDVPEKTDKPKKTDSPAKTQGQPNTEKVAGTDATPKPEITDKPKSTPAPKDKQQETKATPPDNGKSGGQGKDNKAQEGAKEPEQPSKGGENQKGKP